MKHFAVLYTCYNRKEKTLASLKSLYDVAQRTTPTLSFKVYLTDDGSTDGTAEAVSLQFPEVQIIEGDGTLFWAEGMRKSWKAALDQDYEAFLLLNDDVELYENLFDQLLKTHKYAVDHLGKSGIYIGATEDRFTKKLTYSGSILLNRFLYTAKRLEPNGKVQRCDMANANIMMVTKEAVAQIGILSEGYSHGMADYDYSLMANRSNIPVLIAPAYCGHCLNDHTDHYEGFAEKSFKERKNHLYKPNGLALGSYKKYMWKFFPFRYPFVVFFGWLKLYFPKLYLNFFRNR
ncbi:glycosyltransferase family 2 protein [Maribacter sp. 2-571]|uniref:glycosyltransferase family 2 protein n=1 Tax=Maribacter sp. 2-571 TaxID=3417569 RepID=UPI003D34E224